MSISILGAGTSKTERNAMSRLSMGSIPKFASTKQTFNYKRTSSQLDFERDLEILSVMNLDYWEGVHTGEVQKPTNNSLASKFHHQNLLEENKKRRQSKVKPLSNNELNKINSKHFKDYENSLASAYKSIEKRLQESLTKRENQRKKLCDLKEEMNNLQQILEKIPKELLKYTSQKEIKKPGNAMSSYLSQKLMLKEKSEKQKLEIMQHMELLQIEISGISRDLQQCDEETSSIRKEIKLAKNELIFHYIEILKQGTDTRSEGLAWIVKALKKLNKEILREMMPLGMDEKSYSVILEIADRLIKLDQCYELLSHSKTPDKRLVCEEKPALSERLNQVKKKMRIRKPEFFKKKLSWTDEELVQYQDGNWKKNYVSDAIRLEEMIKRLKSEILEIQKQETKRLTKECVKTGANLKTAVSRVVGVENLEKFLIISMKELKEIDVLRQSISTFKFSSKLMPKPTSRGIFKSVYI